jgi:lipid II:glycine glycyltransferase (peptidoglycan interpeptide bridge formation enzyme)
VNIKKVSSKDKNQFNKVAVHPLQSWEWGEFRKAAGNEVVRLGVYNGRQLTDAVQVVFSKIPHTNFKIGTAIRGSEPTKIILVALKELARKENAIFIKLEPFVKTKSWVLKNTKAETRNSQTYKLVKLLKANECVPGKTLFTPTSFWIDLTRSEDDLLKNFHSKTRYNIRYAKRHGVKVVEDNSEKAFDKYIQLTRETVERQGFYAHTEKYHRLMWKYLSNASIAHLLTAKYKKEVLTTWIVFTWQDFLYYPYGASTNKYKNLQANSLMMWEAIRFGKKHKLKTFDLWGREEGKGFTRFKEGFNPQIVEFLGTWDLVTSPLYQPYKIAEYIRWNLLRMKSKFTKPSF